MGRGARNICIGVLLAMALAASLSGPAGAAHTKVRPPRVSRLVASSSGRSVRLSASINPEGLQSSFALELVYRPSGCCPPKSKECCKEEAEAEVVGSGTLAAGSSAHEVHASATLRSGNYSVRFRVKAANRAGNSEKSHKLS